MVHITLQSVQKHLESFGCNLLEETYINSSTPLKYCCNCGRITTATWNNLSRRKPGWKCKKIHRLDIDFIRSEFTKRNCKLLEDKYVYSDVPMKYICSCGNSHQMSWDNFKQNHKCNKCGYDEIRGSNNHLWNPNRQAVLLNEKIRKKYYHMLRQTLRAAGTKKDKKSLEILGYTSNQLLEHLMKHPDWVVLKNKNWQLDHIFPIKAFVDYGIFDIQLINGLDNLRPSATKNNLSKGGSYNPKEFEIWLTTKGHVMAND